MFDALKSKALAWFNSQDPTREVHLAAFAGGVFSLIACTCWWTVTGPRDMALVAAMGVLAGAVTGGLFKRGSNASQPAPAPGAQDEEGSAK